ncbi:MAG: cyclophilin-like fold protein [Chloroflexi bacterium]|nr:cyclophilin-like fold protein [Chloroflexota bacterium]
MARRYHPILALIIAIVFVAACVPAPTPTTPPAIGVPATAVPPAPTAPPAQPTSPPPTGVPTAVPATEISPKRTDSMKIRLKVEDTVMTATLIDSKTTRAFVALLPLTLTMNDLFRREKYGHLPRAISNEGERTHTFQVGEIAYWSPGPDVAIFYRHDGPEIPDPGIIVIGQIDSGVETLNGAGSIQVTIELIK